MACTNSIVFFVKHPYSNNHRGEAIIAIETNSILSRGSWHDGNHSNPLFHQIQSEHFYFNQIRSFWSFCWKKNLISNFKFSTQSYFSTILKISSGFRWTGKKFSESFVQDSSWSCRSCREIFISCIWYHTSNSNVIPSEMGGFCNLLKDQAKAVALVFTKLHLSLGFVNDNVSHSMSAGHGGPSGKLSQHWTERSWVQFLLPPILKKIVQ